MNAIEFVENFGVSEAKKVVDYRDKYAKECHTYLFTKGGGSYSTSHSYTSDGLNVNVDDLKQIVEAFELVKKHGGLNNAKYDAQYLFADWDYRAPMERRLKQAIELVEKCNASD